MIKTDGQSSLTGYNSFGGRIRTRVKFKEKRSTTQIAKWISNLIESVWMTGSVQSRRVTGHCSSCRQFWKEINTIVNGELALIHSNNCSKLADDSQPNGHAHHSNGSVPLGLCKKPGRSFVVMSATTGCRVGFLMLKDYPQRNDNLLLGWHRGTQPGEKPLLCPKRRSHGQRIRNWCCS